MRLVAAVVVVALWSVPARAQAPDPKVAAKQYVDAGLAAQKTGDYDTAIDLYTKAYSLAPHPILHFNIAQAHRLASASWKHKDAARAAAHRDAAREFYHKFLSAKPEGDLEVTAQGWLAKLDQEWAEDNPKEEAARRAAEDRKREQAIAEEKARLAARQREQAARDKLEQQHIGTAVSRARSDSEHRKAGTVKLIGLGIGGAGLVAVGTGVYFGWKARALASDLSHDDVYDVGRINRGNQAERDMTISYIVGGTLVVGGTITYVMGHLIGSAAERIAVVPHGGDGAAVVLRGTF